MPALHIDFESRSPVDLKKRGLAAYCEDPFTDFLCMAYAFDQSLVELCINSGTPALPFEVCEHVKSGGEVVAHNANFEWNIWNKICVPKYGWPELKVEQLTCTMAMAYAMNIPASLDKSAQALGLKYQKDMIGHRAMLSLCKPKEMTADGTPIWRDDLAKLEAMHSYCMQDLEVERELYKRLLRLTPKEKALWVLDQKINERGMMIDVDALNKAIKIVEFEKDRLDKEMRALTDNRVATCTAAAQLVDFIRDHGVQLDGVAKSDVLDALSDEGLPEVCRKALELRREGSKSSTAKIAAMLNRVSADGRLRNTLQYHGAGQTGRWAGRGVQIHNLPRGNIGQSDADFIFETIKASE